VEEWRTLYERQISKFDNIDKYILKNLKKKKVYLNAIEKYLKNKKIIECGCGTGKISTYFQNKGYSVTAVDIDENILKLAENIVERSSFKETPKFEVMSIMNLKYKNKTFDVVFSNGVLEHFKDNEIIKILKEEIRIADVVVFGVPSKYFNDNEFMHGDERYLTKEEWRTLIKKANGKILEEDAFHSQSLKKRIKNKKIFRQKEFNLFIIKEEN
jgi:2-polyprenyl-3-methyl-5-hydroxy-6-metoxy-1,4-benzoquinol methylase